MRWARPLAQGSLNEGRAQRHLQDLAETGSGHLVRRHEAGRRAPVGMIRPGEPGARWEHWWCYLITISCLSSLGFRQKEGWSVL